MNELVKELKREAEALAYEEHKANCIKNGRDPSMPHANALNMTFEKFAELIVRQCTNMLPNDSVRNEDGVHMFYVIREHFGVPIIGR